MAVRSTDDDYRSQPSLAAEGQPEFDDVAPGKAQTGDPQEGRMPPRDHAIGANAFGTTVDEQREGESLDQKLAREMPEVGDPSDKSPSDIASQLVFDGAADLAATALDRELDT